MTELTTGLLLPLIGTALGSLGVVFMKRSSEFSSRKMLSGFAAGVMLAASIWSLILPAVERSRNLGHLAFIPALMGLWVGFFVLWLCELVLARGICRRQSDSFSDRTLLILAVVIHNIPEGMAVGAAFAACYGADTSHIAPAVLLSLGIAIQNLPEGAVISMPLLGIGKGRAFLMGVLSGVVEPIAAVLTLIFSSMVIPLLPYFLSFAAGGMIYVTVSELIPEASSAKRGIGIFFFFIGFSLMMVLDMLFL